MKMTESTPDPLFEALQTPGAVDPQRVLSAARQMDDPLLSFEIARTLAAMRPDSFELLLDCAGLALNAGKPATAVAMLWAAVAKAPEKRESLSGVVAQLLRSLGSDESQTAALIDALITTPQPAALRDGPAGDALDETPMMGDDLTATLPGSAPAVLKDFLGGAQATRVRLKQADVVRAPREYLESLRTAERRRDADIGPAIHQWEALVTTAPRDGAARLAYSTFLFDAGLPFEALEESYYAFLLAPDESHARMQLGQAYARLGDARRAQVFLGDEERIDPTRNDPATPKDSRERL